MTLAYHFTNDRLRDGRPVPAIGKTLVHDGPIEWCKTGLYASHEAFDALQFAPGPWLHRIECDQIEREDDEKFVCRRRTILATIDATDLLMAFARAQALSVIHLWDAPDIVRQYLTTGDESLRTAARTAAQTAAWTAARTAAWAATRYVAWAAAGDAARYVAWAAARYVAWAAARAAAWAAWDTARDAGWATWDAARDAAWDAARTDFNARVEKAFRAARS